MKEFQNKNKIRLITVFVGILILFFTLLIKLYTLQIVQGDFLKNQVLGTISKLINLDAPRGNIYDKFGRPLATNESSFTLNIDPSISIPNINDVILKTINLLEKNNEQIVDDFPISKEEPYTFLFGGSPSLEKHWKRDMDLSQNLTAEQAFKKLRNDSYFGIDKNLSDKSARKILLVRSELYKKRFSKFIPIILAYDVNKKTITEIEENASEYIGVFIDVESKRIYPSGDSFSHILGYIRTINSEELEYYKDNGFTEYSLNDIVGKEGIEKAFETDLNGKDGTDYYEVDNLGRKITKDEQLSVDPISGSDVFLTLDATLNDVIYNTVEETLRDVIVNRLLGKNSAGPNLSSKQIYASMIRANNLDIKTILASNDKTTYAGQLKAFIVKEFSNMKDKGDKILNVELAKELLADGVENQKISQRIVLLSMFEQGLLKGDDNYIRRIKVGNLSPLSVLLQKLNSLEITPHMTGLLEAPASTSVLVTDVTNGDVIASVSYPSYDNNRFVNNFDNDYYRKLSIDPTSPMLNRPFTEPRAPGSTFKMIVAIAALESGIITPHTLIYDKDVFTKAGKPYAQCWVHGSHGNVDVAKSLEVSCNYFYYDTSYKMGIEILNRYMKEFGLDTRSGVEIYELYDASSLSKYPSKISSPSYKEYIEKSRNPDASSYDIKWTAGDTIRTAIGQAYNNYTAAILVKYIATLANGGYRYSLHFMDKVTNSNGDLVDEYDKILEHKIDIKPENLKVVHEGMYRVTSGSRGTLRNSFKDLDIKIAAKSGTAQQSLDTNDHTVFIGFAPYENPQIAITVFIPYGTDSLKPAAKITKKILEEYMGLNKKPEKAYKNTLTK